MACKQQYRVCVHPCPRCVTGGDTHTLCVVCLGEEHAQSALEGGDCEHCCALPLRTLRSRLARFNPDHVPQGSGPTAAEARRRSQTWGSQMDLSLDVETGSALSQHPSDRSSASHQGVEARTAVSSPPMEAPMLQLSSSEELDVVSVEAESEDSPPQSHAFEELLDVVTRAVHRLSIEWPEDRQDVRSKSKLDERFLPSRTQPQRRSLPFFPDLHTEVSRSWGKPVSYRVYAPQTSHYSSIQKYKEYGNGEMPKVEETLASYLSPATASSLKTPSLPSKPGTVLPTLPPLVLQGAAVSGEHISQGPPGNVVASGCPPPPRRVLEQSVWSFPAGAPLQGVEPTTQQQQNPETSLERLVLLVESLTAWKLLSNVSRWVLQTVGKAYQIQFKKRPPRFMGVLPTVVGPEQVLVMEQEVNTLLEKGAIEYVPPSNRETGFYSRYFIVPKKDGGLRPILDLRVLNESVMQLKFKMLTLRQIVPQIRSEDWFVTIDLKDAYFHISIRPCHWKFLRFAFGGKAYQYSVLPFGLALSPRTFTKCVDAALAPLRLQGIRIMNYIDDWLILAQSHQLAVQHRDVVLAHMK
ncbi:unnamed protein product [Leuciscus chuanchicus]